MDGTYEVSKVQQIQQQMEALQSAARRCFAVNTTAMRRGYLRDLKERPLASPVGFEPSRGCRAESQAESQAELQAESQAKPHKNPGLFD